MRKQAIRAERPKARKREIERVLNVREVPYCQVWTLAKTTGTNMTGFLRDVVAREFRKRISELIANDDRAELDKLRAACLLAGIDQIYTEVYDEVRKGIGNGTDQESVRIAPVVPGA